MAKYFIFQVFLFSIKMVSSSTTNNENTMFNGKTKMDIDHISNQDARQRQHLNLPFESFIKRFHVKKKKLGDKLLDIGHQGYELNYLLKKYETNMLIKNTLTIPTDVHRNGARTTNLHQKDMTNHGRYYNTVRKQRNPILHAIAKIPRRRLKRKSNNNNKKLTDTLLKTPSVESQNGSTPQLSIQVPSPQFNNSENLVKVGKIKKEGESSPKIPNNKTSADTDVNAAAVTVQPPLMQPTPSTITPAQTQTTLHIETETLLKEPKQQKGLKKQNLKLPLKETTTQAITNQRPPLLNKGSLINEAISDKEPMNKEPEQKNPIDSATKKPVLLMYKTSTQLLPSLDIPPSSTVKSTISTAVTGVKEEATFHNKGQGDQSIKKPNNISDKIIPAQYIQPVTVSNDLKKETTLDAGQKIPVKTTTPSVDGKKNYNPTAADLEMKAHKVGGHLISSGIHNNRSSKALDVPGDLIKGSKDSVWALGMLVLVLGVLTTAVYWSKMWKRKNIGWFYEPVKQEEDLVDIRDILKSKEPYLPKRKNRKVRKKKNQYVPLKLLHSINDDDSEEEELFIQEV
ncbi:unnamed protein product [Owenia fusiformis]|uniref:Uncharacterized protein n=1 Tax=Owenia fusiformis TaxID=6347 RepID=A0A8J1XPV1_OWEFU|nr:unnamed protein product [Owenia fusiformis]